MSSQIHSPLPDKGENTISMYSLERCSVGWLSRHLMGRWYRDTIQSDDSSSPSPSLEPSLVALSPQNSINTSITSKLLRASSSSLVSCSGCLSDDSVLSPQDFATSPMDFPLLFLGELTLVMGYWDIRRWSMRWFFWRYFLWYLFSDYTRRDENGG